jgi:peptidoglycan/LPS O-acetylase OafA/YrhL
MLADRLRRVTRDGRWIPEIDGLRFLAISSVLLFHLLRQLTTRMGRPVSIEPQYWWLEQLLRNGERGVRIFFVISGMILALPFALHHLAAGKKVSLGKYYMRRLTRLEPPYIAALLIAAILIAAYAHGLGPGFIPHFLASLIYQHGVIYAQLNPVNPAAWSLEVEVQFYVLAPAIMLCYKIRPTALRRAILLAVIFALPFAQMPFHTQDRVNLSILFYLQYFLMGLVVADIFILDIDRIRSSWAWDIVGIVALGAIFWPQPRVYWAHAILPIPIAALFLAALRGRALRAVFANTWVAVIGGMCYSIYLLHLATIPLVFKLTRHFMIPNANFFINYAVQLLLTVVPAVALCAVFFVLVERPCMDPDWPAKLWHKLTGRPTRELAILKTSGV